MILISSTDCKFLNSMSVIIHEEGIPYKFVNLSDIYMYYDIYRPKFVLISDIDETNKAIIQFEKETDCKIIREYQGLVLDADEYKEDKNDYIAIFMDNIRYIPKPLESVILPNVLFPIRIFNCIVKHPQNCGMINELEKIEIIKTYKGLIDCTNKYKNECDIHSTFYSTPELIDQKMISHWLSSNKSPLKNKYRTYKEYLMELLDA